MLAAPNRGASAEDHRRPAQDRQLASLAPGRVRARPPGRGAAATVRASGIPAAAPSTIAAARQPNVATSDRAPPQRPPPDLRTSEVSCRGHTTSLRPAGPAY